MDNVNALRTAPFTPSRRRAGDPPAPLATRFLRLEGLALLCASALAFQHLGGSWALFGLLFLLPDSSLLGYLRSAEFGAWAYNLAHSTLLPGALGLAGWLMGSSACWLVALIWTAHIGFDRLLGYGLKQRGGFRDKHLGRIGKGG